MHRCCAMKRPSPNFQVLTSSDHVRLVPACPMTLMDSNWRKKRFPMNFIIASILS